MIYLIVFSTLAVLTAAQSTVDDTPYSNLTMELVQYEGPLVVPTAYVLSDDKSKYEGRWYVAYNGLKEEHAEHTTCVVFDVFFDKDGNLHSFFNIQENGETRVVIAEKKPDKPKDGIYDLYLGQPESEKMKGVLFYVDEDIIALWNGLDAGDKHEQYLLVGLRNLESLGTKQTKISEIYSSLKSKGADSQKSPVSHEDCNYPEAMKNPYSSK